MLKVLIYLNILLLSINEVYSGENEWTLVKKLTSKSITTIKIDPNDLKIIYAGSLGDGIFKSFNRGKSWAPLNNKLKNKEILSFAIDPIKTNILYAGTTSSLFFSRDKGKNWIQTPLDSVKIYSLSVIQEITGVVYAGTSNGVYFFDCNSEVVRIQNIGLKKHHVKSLVVGMLGEKTKVIVVKEHSLMTLDYQDMAIIYAGTNRGQIFKKRIVDNDWEDISPQNMITVEDTIFSLTLDPYNAKVLYAGTNHGIFKSIDGGKKWFERMESRLDDLSIYSLMVNPLQTNIIYAATSTSGVFRSKDFAVTWHPLNFGIFIAIQSFAGDFKSDEKLLSGTKNGEIFEFEIGKMHQAFWGVLNFEVDGLPVDVGEEISTALCSKMNNAVRILFIKKTKNDEVYIQNEELGESIKAGVFLGVNWLISGKVSRKFNKVWLNFKLLNIKTGEVIESETIKNFSIENYHNEIVKELINKTRKINKGY